MGLIVLIAVLAFLIVVALGELIEWATLEDRAGNVPGYGPWKGGHLFSPFPEGWFTDREVIREQKDALGVWVGISIVVLLSLFWTLVNIPELFHIAVIYSFLYLLGLTIAMTELMMPVKTWVTAIPRSVGIYGTSGDVVIGVLGGLGFVSLIGFLSSAGLGVEWAVKTIPHGLIVNVWLIGSCIPIAEEYFFNKLTATGIENYGVIPGILGISVLVWVLFHFSVYGLVGPMIAVLVLFGLYRGLVLLKTKGYVASIIAHVIVNSVMILTALG